MLLKLRLENFTSKTDADLFRQSNHFTFIIKFIVEIAKIHKFSSCISGLCSLHSLSHCDTCCKSAEVVLESAIRSCFFNTQSDEVFTFLTALIVNSCTPYENHYDLGFRVLIVKLPLCGSHYFSNFILQNYKRTLLISICYENKLHQSFRQVDCLMCIYKPFQIYLKFIKNNV